MSEAPVDIERLAAWLREHVAPFEGLPTLQALAGGQSNPTYRVQAGPHRWVLRRKPPGALLASAHAVDREFRVLKALAGTDVPVPRVHALCEDESVIGSIFYVMDFLEGRSFMDPALPGMPAADREAIYRELQRVLAAIHRVDLAAVGLQDYGRPGNYLARQLDRWSRQYRASQTDPIAEMESLIEWLQANLPAEVEPTLVHGDFRLDNVIFHPTEPRALAVIDWELSTLGNPEVDLAYHCMAWRLTPQEFRGLRGHPLSALGIPDEAAQVAGWCAHTGRERPRAWTYHLAFNMFRLACILQGILARALQGNAASADAQATGHKARLIAQAGWRLVQEHEYGQAQERSRAGA